MMKTLRVVAVAAATIMFALPATASAEFTSCNDKQLKHKYRVLRDDVQDRFTRRTPGRHIVRDGLTRRKPSSCRQIGRGVRTFRRWLAPPPTVAYSHDRAPTTTAVASSPHYAGGRYSIPTSIVMCESGGNYNAVNPSSGARGAYQIMPSTHAAMGCTGWSPAEQDACAAKIWAVQGRGAWVC